jgi:hypothetical protein
MPQFKVVLDEIEVSDREAARINSAIQRTVLNELASIDRRGDEASVLLENYGPWPVGRIRSDGPVTAERPGLGTSGQAR